MREDCSVWLNERRKTDMERNNASQNRVNIVLEEEERRNLEYLTGLRKAL